jgi:hypothetical protein
MLQQVQGHALRRLQAHAGQTLERVDQASECGLVHLSAPGAAPPRGGRFPQRG